MPDQIRATFPPTDPPPRPGGPLEFGRGQDHQAYRAMLLIRHFEEKAGQLYGMGYIGGFCHLYIGQEAVVTGLRMAAADGDQVIATYRDHGHMLAAGMQPKAIMAELLGRRDGYSKGKGGSVHMFSKKDGFFGGHGIVGANVPLGSGIAFANKYRDNGQICWCFFGDGAADQGQVYEVLNMAALWRLPIVFVIENNTYDSNSEIEHTSAVGELSQRGRPFAIPGWQVDGMDVRAVCDAGRRAGVWVRGGNGPFILEMLTHRYRGHSMSDPAKYGNKSEERKGRESLDPIAQVRLRLIDAGISDEELRNIDRDVRQIVNEAAAFAQAAAEPDMSELYRDVVALQ